jgi:hypothetical protein
MTSFHVHIDAVSMSEDFDRFLAKLGFWRSDFAGHPEGEEGHEPPHHLTQKTASSDEFKALFDKVVAYASTHDAMRGYVEGECITIDKDIEPRPFDPSVKPPFKIIKTTLPAGTFRETEIHITLSRDESDPRLLKALQEMGLFSAYLPKPEGIFQVFTVQGAREKFRPMLPALIEYLEKAGGSVRCSIKEERVAQWWKSSPEVSLPPVIDSIE